jgi:hypothetical protein
MPEPSLGIFVSFDQGARWHSLQLNLPVTPVTDLRVHRTGSGGGDNGPFVLDSRQSDTPATDEGSGWQRRRCFWRHGRRSEPAIRQWVGVGLVPAEPEYPPPGATDRLLSQSEELEDDLKLEILDSDGIRLIRTLSGPAASDDSTRPAAGDACAGQRRHATQERRLLARTQPFRLGSAARRGSEESPAGRDLPDRWLCQAGIRSGLSTDKWSLSQPLVVKLDPRLARDGVTTADLREQLDLISKVGRRHARARSTRERGSIASWRLRRQNGQRRLGVRARAAGHCFRRHTHSRC